MYIGIFQGYTYVHHVHVIPDPLEGQPVLLPLNHLSSAMNHFSFHNTT